MAIPPKNRYGFVFLRYKQGKKTRFIRSLFFDNSIRTFLMQSKHRNVFLPFGIVRITQ